MSRATERANTKQDAAAPPSADLQEEVERILNECANAKTGDLHPSAFPWAAREIVKALRRLSQPAPTQPRGFDPAQQLVAAPPAGSRPEADIRQLHEKFDKLAAKDPMNNEASSKWRAFASELIAILERPAGSRGTK